jgi:hypothetical protein
MLPRFPGIVFSAKKIFQVLTKHVFFLRRKRRLTYEPTCVLLIISVILSNIFDENIGFFSLKKTFYIPM